MRLYRAIVILVFTLAAAWVVWSAVDMVRVESLEPLWKKIGHGYVNRVDSGP